MHIPEQREEPCGRDRRASEIEYLFSVSFPLVGNPSDCSRSQERFWTSQNDRNKELRQRPQGVKFIKIKILKLTFTKRRAFCAEEIQYEAMKVHNFA
jgi:hypothetical protein